MRYMLDTCTFLYLANDHDLLTKEVADILHDPENVLCILLFLPTLVSHSM